MPDRTETPASRWKATRRIDRNGLGWTLMPDREFVWTSDDGSMAYGIATLESDYGPTRITAVDDVGALFADYAEMSDLHEIGINLHRNAELHLAEARAEVTAMCPVVDAARSLFAALRDIPLPPAGLARMASLLDALAAYDATVARQEECADV